jgi:hypothetical protein
MRPQKHYAKGRRGLLIPFGRGHGGHWSSVLAAVAVCSRWGTRNVISCKSEKEGLTLFSKDLLTHLDRGVGRLLFR